MPAGTIALTNNSTAVTGSGTSFTSELKANDFIVTVVGGVTYTLGVQSVNSATSVTLATAYNGPNASGVAWTALPNGATVSISAQTAADTARAIRGLNLDKANWQQVYSASGNITVTLPDGSSYSGPSWNSVVNSVGGKLDKTGGSMTGSLSLPAIELFSATPFIDFHFGSSATDYNVRLINDTSGVLRGIGKFDSTQGYVSRAGIDGVLDNNVPWSFYWNYGGVNALFGFAGKTNLGYINFTSTSDAQLKKDIIYLDANDADRALSEIDEWKPAVFRYKQRGIIPESGEKYGFIANDLIKASPQVVQGKGLPDNYDIDEDPNNPDAYTLDQIAIITKLAQAIQSLNRKISAQDTEIDELKKRMMAIDGLDE